MKLIPHHQDDKHGTREYRSPERRLASRADPPPWRKPERAAALGGSRALRGPRRRLASSRRLRAPTGRAGLPGHHGRSVGGRERHDSARQAARDPRTLAGTTPVQPAPDAEGADHARPRRNPLPGHPVVVVRRAPVRSEADRQGGRAGDLREVPAVPVGGQLPETPGSDEGGEEGDLTGRRVGPAADRKRGRTPAPPAPRNGSSVVMTTETEFNISEEPLTERVLRHVRSGQLDESRLLPSAEKRRRDVGKKLNPLAARQGWYTFMAGQAYAVANRESARDAERGGHGGGSRSCAGGRRCPGSRPIGWADRRPGRLGRPGSRHGPLMCLPSPPDVGDHRRCPYPAEWTAPGSVWPPNARWARIRTLLERARPSPERVDRRRMTHREAFNARSADDPGRDLGAQGAPGLLTPSAAARPNQEHRWLRPQPVPAWAWSPGLKSRAGCPFPCSPVIIRLRSLR